VGTVSPDATTRARPSGERALSAEARPERPTAAVAVLGAAMVVWVLTFSVLVWLKHDRFASVDFDMGIHDQSIWLLAQLRGFMTVRGLQVFGHHATPGYFLFAPLYWLGGGPHLLNIAQVCVAAAGAVPVFLLARYRTASAWAAATLGIAYLLQPALQFFMAELFHPEVIAITPLLCAYYCSVRKRWGWFALWAVLALCWKEDVALALVVLGLIIAARGDRKIGLLTAGAAALWFSLWIFALFPIINDGKLQNEGLYADVGGSPGGVARAVFTHPGRIADKVVSADAGRYAWKLLAPYGLVALAAPLVLLMGLPQAFLNLVTNVPWTKTITFHYAAVPFAAVTLAAVEGFAYLARKVQRRDRVELLAVAVLLCAFAATVVWGPSPIGNAYRDGEWALTAPPGLAHARAAVDLIPDGAPVSASYNMLPHLAHRPEIYSFPNPWESRNFGIDGEPRRSGTRVRWIVLDRRTLGADSKKLFERLVDSGRFRIVFDRADYVVARRVAA
jgi:uncharacterized membrane protein